MSQLRRDPVTDDWVIIAPGRSHRPHVPGRPAGPEAPLPHFDPTCPFCPGNEAQLPAILAERARRNGQGWQTRVVPNKFPAVSADGPEAGTAATGFQIHAPAAGCHDVLIESPRHDRELATMDDDEIQAVFAAYRDQCARRMVQPEIQSLVLFRNHGASAGASLRHPHAQLIALTFEPPHMRVRQAAMECHFEKQGRCLLCELMAAERADGTRVVSESDKFLTIVPYAARVPFELWLLPKRHADAFHDCEDEEVAQLGFDLRDALLRLQAQFEALPYKLVWETAARRDAQTPFSHWFLRLVPHTAVPAGFELGSGLAINISRPEDDAAALREIVSERTAS